MNLTAQEWIYVLNEISAGLADPSLQKRFAFMLNHPDGLHSIAESTLKLHSPA